MDSSPRVITPPTEIDPSTCAELDAQLGLCDAEDRCTVDFSGVQFCDSSGLRVLTTHWLRHHEAGGELLLVNVSPRIQRVFRAAGIATMFGLDEP